MSLNAPIDPLQPVTLLAHVLRLTAPNPGLMTGPGTNSYLVGDAARGFLVLDPGPADAGHAQRLWQTARHPDGSGGNVRLIVCTHSHPDHAPGAWLLQALCAAPPPVLGLPALPTARPHSAFVPDRALHDQEVLRLEPGGTATDGVARMELLVLHTPGHAANHLCLLLAADGLLFSGDHILNGSTTVIDPPDGHMGDYLAALDALHGACGTFDLHTILPAHGSAIANAPAAIAALTAHRRQREAKVAAAMAALPQGTLDDWLPRAYDDVAPALWPLARRSLLAHVEHLQALAPKALP